MPGVLGPRGLGCAYHVLEFPSRERPPPSFQLGPRPHPSDFLPQTHIPGESVPTATSTRTFHLPAIWLFWNTLCSFGLCPPSIPGALRQHLPGALGPPPSCVATSSSERGQGLKPLPPSRHCPLFQDGPLEIFRE